MRPNGRRACRPAARSGGAWRCHRGGWKISAQDKPWPGPPRRGARQAIATRRLHCAGTPSAEEEILQRKGKSWHHMHAGTQLCARQAVAEEGWRRQASRGRQREAKLLHEQCCQRHAVHRFCLKLCQCLAHGRRGPTLQYVARRWPQQEHVLHAGDAGEHDIEMQPPLVVGETEATTGFHAAAINRGPLAECLALGR